MYESTTPPPIISTGGWTLPSSTTVASCFGGHIWTYCGGIELKDGTPCDCGLAFWKKPAYCPSCGHQI